jgi:hypothetical protein
MSTPIRRGYKWGMSVFANVSESLASHRAAMVIELSVVGDWGKRKIQVRK